MKRAALLRLVFVTSVTSATSAWADAADDFFTDGTIVAQRHFSGPATPRQSMWLRQDGRVLLRHRPSPMDLLGGDGQASTWAWQIAQVDTALVANLQRAVEQSGVCRAQSVGGYSVEGAYLWVFDFGPRARCRYRRRAHLDVPPPIARVRELLRKILDAAEAATPLLQGTRDTWKLGDALDPSL